MVENKQALLERFFENCHRRVYPRNSTVIAAGDESSSIFYILSGSVSVIIEDDNGHEIILAYLNAGDFFGEIGLFDEKGQRSAWVRARTTSEIAQLGYDRLRDLSARAPDIVFAMLGQMSLRVRNTSRKVGDLAFKDVTGRIAGALLDLCEQPDAVRKTHGIEVQITRQELGRIVGCSREMASRVLRNLEDRHLVSVDGKSILIHGRRRLSESTRARDRSGAD
ncbi:MAG TPA: cAMP-activated global transcriptional regulator CRP [Gammaproteobacteria bacterium]